MSLQPPHLEAASPVERSNRPPRQHSHQVMATGVQRLLPCLKGRTILQEDSCFPPVDQAKVRLDLRPHPRLARSPSFILLPSLPLRLFLDKGFAINKSRCMEFFSGPASLKPDLRQPAIRKCSSRKVKTKLVTGPQRGQIPAWDKGSAFPDSSKLNRS